LAELLEIGNRVEALTTDYETWYMCPGHYGTVTAVGNGYYVLMDDDPERKPWWFGFMEVRKVEEWEEY
jgi:hypothetical protein